MGRRCTVCEHPLRLEIDRALLADQDITDIARCYHVGTDALGRHRKAHLLPALAALPPAPAPALGEPWTGDLLSELRALQERSLRILDAAEASGDAVLALKAIRELRANLELLVKLAGLAAARQAEPTILRVEYSDERPAIRAPAQNRPREGGESDELL